MAYELAPLGLGYWSQWYTPPPMWVALPFQKVPSVLTTAASAPNTERLTLKPSASATAEYPQLNAPAIFFDSTQGSLLNRQDNRGAFSEFSSALGYYPNVTTNPPYGAVGSLYSPTNSGNNYNLISDSAVAGFNGSSGTQWAYSWAKGADVSWAGVTEQKVEGTYSCLLTRTGAGSSAIMQISSNSTYGFGSLAAGYTYRFDVWIRAKVNNPQVRLELYGSTNVFTSYSPATSDWTKRSVTVTPATSANYTFRITMDAGAIGDAIYVDGCKVYRIDIPQTTLDSNVPVPHANRSFSVTFDVSSHYGDLFDGIYNGYSGRPQFLWDWVQTGVRAPNAPAYPEYGGYGGGYGFHYVADQPARFMRFGNTGLNWNGTQDMRGRASSQVHAGFHYSWNWEPNSWVNPGTVDASLGLQSGVQWFDWSGLMDTSNWVHFHPTSLLGTGTLRPCSYYERFYYTRNSGSVPAQFSPVRIQYEDEDIQLLDSKLIFETSWLRPPSGVDRRPGYYYNTNVPAVTPGHFAIFRDAPTPISTYYNTPVSNDRGTKILEMHPSFNGSGTLNGITWMSDGPTITPFTYTDQDTNLSYTPANTDGYTHFGAEIGIDLINDYPGMSASFGLHSSYAWNDPVNPNTFVPPVDYGGYGHITHPQSAGVKIHGAFEVLMLVQLPRFRYVIPLGSPSDAPDETDDPVRLQQRDDGIGGYQGHSRIRNINGVKTSDASSGRLPGTPNSYR